MTELDILITFFPLFFISFSSIRDLRKFLGWCSVLLAVICNAYQLRVYLDEPLRWIPVVAFLVTVLVDLMGKKKARGLMILGLLFLVQALLTEKLSVIVLLLLFSDAFFSADSFASVNPREKEKAIQSSYRSMLSFLPVAVCVLLQLPDQWNAILVMLTIILRLFTWPVRNWASNIGEPRDILLFSVGTVSSFILWRTQAVVHEPAWALVWIGIACFFSLGARVTEVVTALSLGLFSLSPAWAVLGTTLWPLLIRHETSEVPLLLVTAVLGSFVFEMLTKASGVQTGYLIAILSSLLFARSFVLRSRVKRNLLLDSLVILFALGVGALVDEFNPDMFQQVPMLGLFFACGLIVFFVIGLFVYRVKAGLFLRLSPWKFQLPLLTRLSISEKSLKSDGPIPFGGSGRIESTFASLESEAYLVFLLGVLGAFLLWGRK